MNKTLKDTEKYILLLNDKIYLRMRVDDSYTFTENYQNAFTSTRLTDIKLLQSQYGGKILKIKEKIWLNEIKV